MRRAAWTSGLIACLAASTFVVTAQVGGKLVIGGNPTPGTAQPDPPNLSDRIAVTGCLRPAPKPASGTDETGREHAQRRAISCSQARSAWTVCLLALAAPIARQV